MSELSVKISREKCIETPIGIGVRKSFKEFNSKTDPLFDTYKKKVIHYYKSIQDDTLTESSLYKKLYKRFDIDNGDHSEGFFADIVDSLLHLLPLQLLPSPQVQKNMVIYQKMIYFVAKGTLSAI